MRQFRVDRMSGNLGRSVKTYQKTLKRPAGDIPWKEIRIHAWGEFFVSFSFDGRTYSDEMLMAGKGSETIMPIAARAVRVRVPRSKEFATYTVVCRD